MSEFTIVGHLMEEPIENIETGEVELKVNISKSNANVVVKTRDILADNAIRYGDVEQLVGIRGYFEDNNQLVAEKITLIKTIKMVEHNG